MQSPSYLIRWRGRQDGPHPLGTLREKLSANEIGLMHEIFAGGRWISLGEFLRELDDRHRTEQQAHTQARQLEQQRQHADQQELALQEVQRQNDLLAEQLDEMRRQQARGRAAPAVYPAAGGPGEDYGAAYPPAYRPPAAVPPEQGVSGMAVTAFVCALLDIVPYLGFVTGILALVFGHIALAEIQRTPGRGGRGLAIAALSITYVFVLLVLVAIIVFEVGGARRLHF